MKTNLISTENNKAKFTMEFSPEELEQGKVKAYQSTKDQFSIDGFRKGKAPRSIIEKHYGSGIFIEEAINTLFNDEYPKAVVELGLDVIDRPAVEFGKFEEGKSFEATVTVPVYPVIEVKDYKGVEVDKIDAELKEEELEEEMMKALKQHARMVEVDRPSQDGDTVLIDYKGFVGDDQFQGGTAEKHPLKLGSNSFIPGFEEQLVGVSVGDEKDVVVTFPTEYHSEDLAGKEAVFKCTVHEIKEEQIPELNDEFAKDVSEFETLDEYKADMKEKMQESKNVQVDRKMKDTMLEKVYNANDIEIPAVMIEDEQNSMIQEFEQQLRTQGMELEQYLGFMGQEIADFRKQIEDDAKRRVKTRMIIVAVAEAEGVEVTPDEVETEIANMATAYGLEADKIKEMIGVENLKFIEKDIKMKKAIDLMYAAAVIK